MSLVALDKVIKNRFNWVGDCPARVKKKAFLNPPSFFAFRSWQYGICGDCALLHSQFLCNQRQPDRQTVSPCRVLQHLVLIVASFTVSSSTGILVPLNLISNKVLVRRRGETPSFISLRGSEAPGFAFGSLVSRRCAAGAAPSRWRASSPLKSRADRSYGSRFM